MTMWKLKNCPRCKGDIFLDSDLEGWYEQCLQCSYRRRFKDITEFEKQPAQRNKGSVDSHSWMNIN